MKRLVVDGYGKFIRRKGSQILVTEGGKVIHRVLAEELRQIVISGKGGISFDAMELLSEYGVDLIVLDWRGEVVSRLSTSLMRTVQTRREQYAAYNDYRGSVLAKGFVYAKMRNQCAVLGTFAKARSDTSPKVSEALMAKRQEIAALIPKIEDLPPRNLGELRNDLMGLEGLGSKAYWEGLATIVPEAYGFPGRSGRYAKDPINAMLNYGYALLEGEVWRGVHFAGLDPYGGFLHVDRPGKPSMVLDLMEEFRQQLIDKTVIALITKDVVKPQDFEEREGICVLSDTARRKLIEEVEGTFESYVRYKDVRIRWADLILNEAVKVAKYLRGEENSYEGFYLRW